MKAAAWLCILLLGAAPPPRGNVRAPVELPLPEGIDPAKPFRLLRFPGGEEVPAQILPGARPAVAFLHEENPAHRDKSPYRIEQAAPRDFPKVECKDDGRSLLFLWAGKKILQYNYAVVSTPGTDPVFDRSGFIHPVWTPEGKVLTNNSPANHLHHHGIWSAWTSSEVDGRKSNFWESKEKQGKVEFVKMEETFSGPVFAGFRARHRFTTLNGPDGPKAVLDEIWEVRVYAGVEAGSFFDLISTQTCLTEKPLVIKQYRYGGIGFRGAKEWEGKDGVRFTTSEGKDRIAGHATKAPWVTAQGKIDGEAASVTFFCHPSNFRAPQPLRIHPDEPFFNWAVPQGGDFSIVPGKPYTASYRFIVSGGSFSGQEVLWSFYTGGSAAELSVRK
jgi:hypothetical protein